MTVANPPVEGQQVEDDAHQQQAVEHLVLQQGVVERSLAHRRRVGPRQGQVLSGVPLLQAVEQPRRVSTAASAGGVKVRDEFRTRAAAAEARAEDGHGGGCDFWGSPGRLAEEGAFGVFGGCRPGGLRLKGAVQPA